MMQPESPTFNPASGELMPGMRNSPIVVKKRVEAFNIEEDQKNNRKWFKHFWDDLGSVAEYENYKARVKTKFTNQYKLMKQKTQFVRGQ